MNTFNFIFNEQEVNTIFKALQELPFKEVVGVINSIQRQIQEAQNNQMQEMPKEPVEEKKEKK